MSVIAPERTITGRDAALRLANQVRFARARMKKQLRTGALDPVVLVETPPDYLETMKTVKFLLALPKWGPTTVRKVMLRAGIAEAKTLGGLSDRQRRELAALIPRRASS